MLTPNAGRAPVGLTCCGKLCIVCRAAACIDEGNVARTRLVDDDLQEIFDAELGIEPSVQAVGATVTFWTPKVRYPGLRSTFARQPCTARGRAARILELLRP